MSLKKAYLYLVSVISLVIWVIGAIMLLNMALKTWVFTKADKDFYYVGPCIAKYNSDGTTMPCSKEEEEKQRASAEENRAAQKQRDASQALAMILIAGPVWYGHWRMAKREV
ncbi:MAG: hypothetical protein JNN11_04720 [Candidatus Doudnabacteria bacterium]|nr:hypothetical protein [Candidatus Doudnabacteria bacterium]